MIVGAVLACSASLLYNVGLALQALDARDAPAEERLRPALRRRLVRRPRWLAGSGLSGLLGWPLQAAKRVSSVFASAGSRSASTARSSAWTVFTPSWLPWTSTRSVCE